MGGPLGPTNQFGKDCRIQKCNDLAAEASQSLRPVEYPTVPPRFQALSSVFTNSASTRARVGRVTRDSISVITTIVRVIWIALKYVVIRVGTRRVIPPRLHLTTPAAIQSCCSALADTAIVIAIAFGKIESR